MQLRGRLVEQGWSAALGYPALVLDPEGPAIDVEVQESDDLPAHWGRLDGFEGPAYERVRTAAHTATDDVEVSVYVLSPSDTSRT
jgi:gamma-glutamylcyclotransferase (GGCT)/AIG2-like uncharacterized protein YtfP